jgi:trehalose 6-phosphate synthase
MKRQRSRRLVAVSNRVGPVRNVAAAGGLAVGLVEALQEHGGLWFGWSGRVNASSGSRVHKESTEGLTLATIDLTQKELDGYYSGFSNNCLWPLLHFRIDLTRFERGELEIYRSVNRRFAVALYKLLKPDDIVWVHDFHLLTLAEELRKLGARQRIGFFLHTPFPPTEILQECPETAGSATLKFSGPKIDFPSSSRYVDSNLQAQPVSHIH